MRTDKRIIATFIAALAFIGIFAGFRWEKTSDVGNKAQSEIVTVKSFGTKVQSAKSNAITGQAFFSSQATTTYEDVVTARSYLVGDVKTGKVYLEQNSKKIMPIASLSKLLTALVSTTILSSSTKIVIDPSLANLPVDGSGIGVGETFYFSDLVFAMLLDSSNIAAEAIASSSGNADFINSMTGYAKELGMTNTSFADASGLSSYDLSTAKDIFVLAQYLYTEKPEILNITKTPVSGTATSTEHGSHAFINIHPFVNDPRFLGGKTGRTDAAGETMLTMLNINNHPIAFIILGANNGYREHDTRLLIEAYASHSQ